jgi:hypothetical protein
VLFCCLIILIFSFCPECNPIEQIGQYLKKGLRWKLPTFLDELRRLITERLKVMTRQVIASITGQAYILEALSVAKV